MAKKISRMDIISQNVNDGSHYDTFFQKDYMGQKRQMMEESDSRKNNIIKRLKEYIVYAQQSDIVIGRADYKLFPSNRPFHLYSYGFGGYEWEWDFTDKDISHWMPLPPALEDV